MLMKLTPCPQLRVVEQKQRHRELLGHNLKSRPFPEQSRFKECSKKLDRFVSIAQVNLSVILAVLVILTLNLKTNLTIPDKQPLPLPC